MSTHTPGPWFVGITNPLLFGPPMRPGINPIGRVYGPTAPELSEQGQRCIADARLIAAAPDLLEALKRMVESITGVDQVSAVNEARAAIDKAEGRT